jgi:polyribonucleotide nucleotidyltransferase
MEAAGAEAAKRKVEALTEEVKVGKVYDGKVTSIKDFGAFIEILPGRDGLCHISELDDKYVGKVEDVVKMGDPIQVKVIAIDEHDRVKLSRKALLREQRGEGPAPPAPPPGPRGEGRPPREGDRGGRGRGEGRGPREERGAPRGDRGPREDRPPREDHPPREEPE